MITKLISGGQTGVDRAALDWAIGRSIPHGGFCPQDRRAEDGRIPSCYELTALPERSYLARTERNVLEADGTLIVGNVLPLIGGTACTEAFCRLHGKPVLVLTAGESALGIALSRFVGQNGIAVLNVAGPRASSAPDIWLFVRQILDEAYGISGCFCKTLKHDIGSKAESVPEEH